MANKWGKDKFDYMDDSGKGWYLRSGETLSDLKLRASGKKKADDK
jgi:hypothetical protein